MKAKQLFNPLHSTDDSREAWRFVGMIAPDKEPELRRAIRSRKADFTTQFEVVRDLSRHGHRSKVELIRYNGGLAVKKTFRNNCLRFLEREASFLEAMSQHRPEILPVFERGENYFITQYVDALPMRASLLGQSFPRLMQLQYVRDLADLLRSIFAHGYDPVDMAPHNLLIDRFGRLKAIDFEFVYHGDQPIDPETSACLDGVKPGFPGEWAAEGRWCLEDPYRERWFGYTGLTRQSFLYGAPWRQRLQRLVNYPAFLVAKALTRQSGRLLAAIKRGLKKYVPAVSLLAESGRGARLR